MFEYLLSNFIWPIITIILSILFLLFICKFLKTNMTIDVFGDNNQIQAMNDLPIQLNGRNLARGLIITSLPGVNSRAFLCPTVPWPQKDTSVLFCECKTSQNNNSEENFPLVISRNLPEWVTNDDTIITNPIFDNIWFVIIGMIILLSFIGICSVLKRANLNMFRNS